jgi:hypothetical protein
VAESSNRALYNTCKETQTGQNAVIFQKFIIVHFRVTIALYNNLYKLSPAQFLILKNLTISFAAFAKNNSNFKIFQLFSSIYFFQRKLPMGLYFPTL